MLRLARGIIGKDIHMKTRMLTLAAAAALLVSPAHAQAQKPAAKPAAQEASAKPAPVAHKSRRNEDARHCLEQPTNSAIIKCAEAYL